MEKKQVTAQDILKALQEKKEQERKEMEEKAKQEALLNVMEIPIPEMPSKEEEKPGVTQDTNPDLSSIQIPVKEMPSMEEVEKQDSTSGLAATEIPVPEMPGKKEDKFRGTQDAISDLDSKQIPIPEVPSKEAKPADKQDLLPDLSSIPVPSPQKTENSVLNEDKNVKSDSCDINIMDSKQDLENIVMPESIQTTVEKSQSDPGQKTKQEDTLKGQTELNLDENKTLKAEISMSGDVQNVGEVKCLQEKNSIAVNKKSQEDNQTSVAEMSISSTAVEVTQTVSISENTGDNVVKEDSNQEKHTAVEVTQTISVSEVNVSENVKDNTEKEDSNQEPQTCESEDVANDEDDDKTIIDDEDTMDNDDVLEISDDDTRDGEYNETMRVSQRARCRPIEDVIEVSMGSLGDVVEVAVGGEDDQDLEGDIECDVDQLYGVIGGESENLDDVLSVGQDRGGAGCFSELGVKPMDVEDVTDGGGMNDEEVGNIVDELMHSNGIESDQESILSGTMGSDFEVVDECEEET
ncbi:uncharacterized protein LOC134260645 isoform X2 [Saccostrea cucullata]|uniref:uncharacterized protein LOC134260645 isoform X2 n=1 Tax=Saccostrea cuccullata TaxID=36930 RepID=UPI002ED52B83